MKPILFSTEMVKAILDGRKTQTRRIIKPQPDIDTDSGNVFFWKKKYAFDIHTWKDECTVACPYFKYDILWVRETWCYNPLNHIGGVKYLYKADGDYGEIRGIIDTKWKPSIFMPKAAARIFLEVADVRVERLNDISEEDAMSEGITLPNYAEQAIKDVYYPEPSTIYSLLWEDINGDGSWNKNPWVWVIEFKMVEKQLLKP